MKLVPVKEAAAYLSMSVSWLYDHTSRKHPIVPSIKIGGCIRYDTAALDEFLQQQAEISRRATELSAARR
jgi:predicted DNA-binding transcriptional regulator AlpA